MTIRNKGTDAPQKAPTKNGTTEGGDEKQRREQDGIAGIGRKFAEFVETYKSSNEAQNKQNNKIFWATIATGVVVFVYTLISAAIWGAQRDANQISNMALIFGKRPFVLVRSIGSSPPYDTDPSGAAPQFVNISPIWTNAGESVPKNLRLFVADIAYTLPDFKEPTPEPTSEPFDLAPHANLYGAIKRIRFDDLQPTNSTPLYIWGWARYADRITEKSHYVTRFCYRLFPHIEYPKSRMVMLPDEKLSIPIPTQMTLPPQITVSFSEEGCPGRGNCMDEECK
jgi:hypothetical protein